LDTFALPDVLRLLASTKKTGCLRLSGDRGEGSVWVDSGSVVAADSTGSGPDGTTVDVVFELLRYGDGSFSFDAGTTAEHPGAPADVEPLLSQAESQLEEWHEIEKVVPSLDAWVILAGELPADEVTLDSTKWHTIVSIGSGTTVAAIGQALGLPEVAVCRRVKDIVELGLGAVLAPSAEAAPSHEAPVQHHDEYVSEPFVVPEEFQTEARAEEPAFEPFSLDLLTSSVPEADEVPSRAPSHAYASDEPMHPFATEEHSFSAPEREPAPAPAPEREPEPAGTVMGFGAADDEAVDADEVARQLASLSPRAARAVAAAAKADTMEEREAALADVTGDDDEPINRGLLLKFLSSVRS
jgi:hypothetical protein